MSPRKKTVAKKSSKHLQFNDRPFRSREVFEAYTDLYNGVVIIVKREVDPESLSRTFYSCSV